MNNRPWFYINSSMTDVDNVLVFLDTLPKNLELLFNVENSNFLAHYVEKDHNYGITTQIFEDSFNESVTELKRSVRLFKIRYNTNPNIINRKIKRIGFTNQSLKLKSSILNKLWSNVINYCNSFTKGIIDFSNNEMVKLVRKFLTYLNSVLGSLTELIPGVESIKEFKEAIESYLSIADE